MIKNILFCALFLSSSFSFSQGSNAVKTSGDVLLFAMPLAAIGATLIIKDKEGSKQFLKGFVVNEVITYGLKVIIKKERPDGSNNNSFPSGHTSTTFQSASFIQKRYGWKYGIPAYALASYTGFTRLNANKHDFVDVFAGAVIGVGSTYLFTTPYQKDHMELTFSKSENNYLIGYKFTF
jgi:membrane-associated phospholipid phosphatase